ncbi:MAG TPA: aldo/keto reductase [Acidimicrobiales bacterium]|nr:aldo/keto reductase [Acidimicrobiales bacterium]
MNLPSRPLGASGLDVSVMALGSWRTYERMTREQGVAVMQAARDAGITFLDDARYDDETGDAPIATGWSEVVFGELFRATGWNRDEVVVSNKLWWEHWPDEDATDELDGSLSRMQFDHVDLIYAMPPSAALPMEVLVEQVGGLLRSGRARAWGTGMWSGAEHLEALDICEQTGVPAPVAAQMATSLVEHSQPDDPEMLRAFERGNIGLVASYALAGGTLTGKYLRGERGRADEHPSPADRIGKELATKVVALAEKWGVPPAHVAFAYAFSHPHLASVLFGARTPEQLRENVAAYETFAALAPDQLDAIRGLATERGGSSSTTAPAV